MLPTGLAEAFAQKEDRVQAALVLPMSMMMFVKICSYRTEKKK
jgi:hypothetical protein